MIKLINILTEALNQQQIVDMAKEFMSDKKSYNYNHDCKRSTFEFIKWVKENKGFEPIALLLAPPKDIRKFPGKSGDGDSHIFAIIDGFGVDFTTNQFSGISEPLKITPESQIPSEYKKIGGYYTDFPDWFENGKTAIKRKFNNLPQWFRDGFKKEGFKPELNEMIKLLDILLEMYPPYRSDMVKKVRYKASDTWTNNPNITEADPKKGTGKKPKGSDRRLYTDEDPKDTVSVKFKTVQDIKDTLSKSEFKSKSHARQSQIINLIHQRVKAAYGKAKDSEVKARLKRGLDYIESRKEASKEKTERLNTVKETAAPQSGKAAPYGSGYAPLQENKEKQKEIPKTFENFADTRGKGAAKIASTAEEKGGLALLTWHHFKVKAPYYKKAEDGKFDKEDAKKEFEKTLKSISLNMTQIEFQREVGRLEVLGELLIRNKK